MLFSPEVFYSRPDMIVLQKMKANLQINVNMTYWPALDIIFKFSVDASFFITFRRYIDSPIVGMIFCFNENRYMFTMD